MTDIRISRPNLVTIDLPIHGLSPLICHRWSGRGEAGESMRGQAGPGRARRG